MDKLFLYQSHTRVFPLTNIPQTHNVSTGTNTPCAAQPGRAISDPKEVAQLVMMRIDQVNAQKDEFTIAVKALADTARQLVNAYSGQQGQIAKLVQRVEELEKGGGK